MKPALKRVVVVVLGTCLTALPSCVPGLDRLAAAGLTAAIAALTGGCSPGAFSPMQVAPAQSQGSPNATASPSVHNSATAAPQTTVNVASPGSAGPAGSSPSG